MDPDNPIARADAPPPRIDRIPVNDTTLHVETRGGGPAVLLIPGGAEDAEGWRAVAERIDGHTVMTYDRRGTLRSGRDAWPGDGAAQHAADVAGLIKTMALRDVVVFGGSSAGVIAVELARRHPDRLRTVLAFEPGYIAMAQGGAEIQARMRSLVEEHLREHDGDWVGAFRMFASQTGLGAASGSDPAMVTIEEWFARREERNAEAFVRDDLTRVAGGVIEPDVIAAIEVDIRFSYGSRSGGMFREIATALAAGRGREPDVIDGVGHACCLHPEAVADYVARHGTPGPGGLGREMSNGADAS